MRISLRVVEPHYNLVGLDGASPVPTECASRIGLAETDFADFPKMREDLWLAYFN